MGEQRSGGIIHINTRTKKQGGCITGMGGAVALAMAAVGAFWLCAGVGLGWLIWH